MSAASTCQESSKEKGPSLLRRLETAKRLSATTRARSLSDQLGGEFFGRLPLSSLEVVTWSTVTPGTALPAESLRTEARLAEVCPLAGLLLDEAREAAG